MANRTAETPVRRGGEAETSELLELAGTLRQAESGVAFIYEALDVVAARYELVDAVLVLDDTPIGRQAFRLHHGAALSEAPGAVRAWVRAALRGPAGLHVQPPVVDALTAAYITDLAATALRRDLLAHDAGHDALTGLLNRRSYETALAEAIGRARRYDGPFAVIMLDLDDFKALNDELGHAAGDEALRVMGAELRAVLRNGDVAARLGGDEFALIVLNVDSMKVVQVLAERLRVALDRSASTARIGFSVGVAAFPADADDAVSLQRIADERLYADKTGLR
jgi:diguanylate cyclase (GGDEF)-like protein